MNAVELICIVLAILFSGIGLLLTGVALGIVISRDLWNRSEGKHL